MLQKFEKFHLNKLDQPFFLFDKEKLKEQINLFKNNFNGKILYAVKKPLLGPAGLVHFAT